MDPLVAEVLQALDIAVIEWRPDRKLHALAPPPDWFEGMTLWSSLPFLENFIPDALAHWRDHADGVISSDPFTVRHIGEDLLLRARAIQRNGRIVMTIERLSGATDDSPILQKAREQALAHEALLDQARAAHAPATAAAQALEQLMKTSLSAEQSPIVERLAHSTAQVQDIVAKFPVHHRARRQA